MNVIVNTFIRLYVILYMYSHVQVLVSLQNVTKPCSHDSWRYTQNNSTAIQKAQHTPTNATEGRGSQPFIQHSQFQCSHSQQLSDAGNLQETCEDYSLDCPLQERPGFIPVLPSPGYVNPIPSCLTPLLTPPILNHPNHTVIHPLPPPLSHHQQSYSAHMPPFPVCDQGIFTFNQHSQLIYSWDPYLLHHMRLCIIQFSTEA